MRNTIQIVGMGYHTPNPSETLQQMQQEEAEVSLVLRQDPLYGAVVMCLYDTEYVGTVTRFDVKRVVEMMQQSGTQTLCGRMAPAPEIDNGFAVEVEGETSAPAPCPGKMWSEWQPELCVTLRRTEEEMCTEEAIALLEQQYLRPTATPRNMAEVRRQSTAEKLLQKLIRQIRFDLTCETQQALERILRILSEPSHPLHALSNPLRREMIHLGSYERREEWARQILPDLQQGEEAQTLVRQWLERRCDYRASSTDMPALLEREKEYVEAQLRTLPAGLYYHLSQPELLFSLLLYSDMPRHSWRQLRTLLALRHQLAGQQPEAPQSSTQAPTTEEMLLAELTPIFCGNEEKARRFLNHVRQQRHDTGITREVRRISEAGEIDPDDKGTRLWSILHEAGLYHCTISTWNKQNGIRR